MFRPRYFLPFSHRLGPTAGQTKGTHSERAMSLGNEESGASSDPTGVGTIFVCMAEQSNTYDCYERLEESGGWFKPPKAEGQIKLIGVSRPIAQQGETTTGSQSASPSSSSKE